MSLQVRLALEGDLEKFTKEVTAKLSRAAAVAVEGYARRLELALRDDTRQGGLGDKVANAWQLKLYSDSPDKPAALVYSKAPLIVTAFSADTTIVAHNGHQWLAIPTDNVPRLGNRRMAPSDIEARFGQKLIFLATRPGTALAFVNARQSVSGKFRAPHGAKQTKSTQLVLMFVMVQQVHLRKRLDWPAIMADAKDKFPDFFGEAIAAALED